MINEHYNPETFPSFGLLFILAEIAVTSSELICQKEVLLLMSNELVGLYFNHLPNPQSAPIVLARFVVEAGS